MKPIPLVRVHALLPCVALLRDIGAPVQRLLASVKLPAAVCDSPQALIPLRQGCHFFEQAARSQGIEIGLHAGQRARLHELGAFGRLVCESFTLYGAITKAARLITAHNSGEQVWLTVQGEQAWLCHRYIADLDHGRQQVDHYVLMYLLQLIQLAGGAEWRPPEVHLETGPASYLDRFEPLAGARLLFNQAATAIRLPRSLLSLPLRKTARLPASPSEAESALWLSAPADDFAGSLRQALEPFLKAGYPAIKLAAEIAGTSIRTLQRQLALNGLRYSRLIEQTRLDRAVELLANPQVKLIEIAFELGYTQAANFTRAFRRWTGVPPSVFRHQRQNG